MKSSEILTLFLCGDVMTGRGVDQILPFSVKPILHEGYLTSAIEYVELAERKNGPIARPVDFSYFWGEALDELNRVKPHARIINLETSITTKDNWEPKGINYRMHPHNVPVLSVAGVDVCTLANNHVLDWGQEGLMETLETLHRNKIQTSGAGQDHQEAGAPAVIEFSKQSRLLVFSMATESSGVPLSWAAASTKSGVHLLPDLSLETVKEIKAQIQKWKRPGDRVLVSIHWGGNWGYEIPKMHTSFAHNLVELAEVDVIHGHSSHHALGIEVYRDRLILYGCGDFLNDYEGIRGYEQFRGDLPLMYFPTLAAETGELKSLRLVPLQIKKLRLCKARAPDVQWIKKTLDREGERFGTRFELNEDHSLQMMWK